MSMRSLSKILMATAATCALTFSFNMSSGSLAGMAAAMAQESGHSGGDRGGSNSDHSSDGHSDSHESGSSTHSSGQQGGAGSGQRRGQSGTAMGGSGRGGIEGHIFEEDEGPSDEAKGPHYGGGREATGKPVNAGTKKGDLLGDMWVILRDENGVPILNADGFVQPLDKDGNLIPLDAEGAPIDESLTVEVELGRTNVGRSPSKVIDRQLDEAVADINAASAVSLDASGRLVLTIDGVDKTIDSPLENLAIYKVLMTTGTIPGITDPSKLGDLSFLADGVKTADDLKAATGFLAGATDKEGALSIDEVVYLDQVLGIPGTITGEDGKTYVDFSSFNYDRQSVYGDTTVQVLVETSPGVYEVKTVNVYDVVFGSADTTGTGVDGFTQAADDARAVLLFAHDNEPR